MKVIFSQRANEQLRALSECEQLNVLYSLQDAARMCDCGRCGKMTKMRGVPGLYRVVAGRKRILGNFYCGTFVVTDILLRNERTYRLMR